AIAKPFGSAVHAVSVVPNPHVLDFGATTPHPAWVDDLDAEQGTKVRELVRRIAHPGVTCSANIVQNEHPFRGILDFAEKRNSDLLVVGSRRRNALSRGLLGSTVTKVLEKSPIPVLVIPRAGV